MVVIIMAIYIHIPFCISICSYCDFCKIKYDKKFVNAYLDMLEKEIKDRYKGEEVKTIFIGGGTPTSLDYDELKKLLDITLLFNKNNNIEFTIESNIESITEDKLKLMKEYGVNRISIGVQSFNDNVLELLGRNHRRADIFDKIKLVKKYFDNINIDLIYASYDDISILKDDLECFLSLDINHLSAYSLMIEDHTLLGIKKFKNIDEDLDYEMYKYIETILEDSGYTHYEISNYAKEGFQSKHNLVYWNNDYYYGFGLSSTSYLNGIRRVNTKNLTKYLKGDFIGSEDKESIKIQMENEVMLGLRKIEGISFSDFKKKFGKELEEVFNIDDLVYDNYLIKRNNRLYIYKKYLYVSNDIIERLFN